MIKRIVFTLLVLVGIVPIEFYSWNRYISPFFWSPGIAYTELGWGYVLVGMSFLFIPISAVASIWGDGK